MSKLNSSTVVLGSCLAWSSSAVIGGAIVEPGGLFTTLTIGLVAASALMLPLGLKKVSDLMDEELYLSGALLGILMGALGLGGLMSALKFIPTSWVLGAALGAPLFSAVIGPKEVKGVKVAAILVGYLGLVTMTGASELLPSQIAGLLLAGLGAAGLGLGLSHYRVKCRNLSRIGLAFWGIISAAVFLLPAAIHEEAWLVNWSLGQAAAGAALVMSALLGIAAWCWMEGRGKDAEDGPLTLGITPVLGLVFLTLATGVEAGSFEVAGLAILGLALGLAGRKDSRETVDLARSLEFEAQPFQAFDDRKAA